MNYMFIIVISAIIGNFLGSIVVPLDCYKWEDNKDNKDNNLLN